MRSLTPSSRYTAAMVEDDRELAYYRAVEDLFAALRGVPHLLSPKDFQLLRTWWREEVPLSAVRTGITEVVARRRERGDDEPVVSLSYCRHAIRKHARRLGQMQVGAPQEVVSPSAVETADAVSDLARKLTQAAAGLRPERPAVAAAVDRIVSEVEAAAELPRQGLEEHLFALESALLGNCLEAIDEETRGALEKRARAEADASAATPEARERTYRALRDRMLRDLLALPRLELGG